MQKCSVNTEIRFIGGSAGCFNSTLPSSVSEDGVRTVCFNVFVKVSERFLNIQKYKYETVNEYPLLSFTEDSEI